MVNLGYSGEQEKRMKAHLWNERAGKSESKVKCFFKRKRENALPWKSTGDSYKKGERERERKTKSA